MANDAVGTDHTLPYERGAKSPADAHSGLFDLLTEAPEDEGAAPAEPDEQAPEAEAEGEPETEEIEASDDGESDDDEDTDEQVEAEPEPEVRKHKFRADGRDLEVTYDELLRHASAGVDYQTKTQALATERKTFEAERTQVRDQYGQKLALLEQAITESKPAEPDWDTLRRENPAEYAAQREEHRTHAENLARVRAEQEAVRAEQQKEFMGRRDEHLRNEGKLLVQAIPEWKDDAKASEEMGKLVSYLGATYGWTPEDLGDVGDHKIVVALRKAMLYDEQQAKGQEALRTKVKPAAKVMAPGAVDRNPKRTRNKEIEAATKRLKRSGRVDDLAAWLEKTDA